jgi:hypothetical protein
MMSQWEYDMALTVNRPSVTVPDRTIQRLKGFQERFNALDQAQDRADPEYRKQLRSQMTSLSYEMMGVIDELIAEHDRH